MAQILNVAEKDSEIAVIITFKSLKETMFK